MDIPDIMPEHLSRGRALVYGEVVVLRIGGNVPMIYNGQANCPEGFGLFVYEHPEECRLVKTRLVLDSVLPIEDRLKMFTDDDPGTLD